MYSPMPVYSYNKETRSRPARDDMSFTPEIGRPSTASSPIAPAYQIHDSISDLLEPAIEGPPSPERIRALSNQMRHNLTSDKHRSELTTSSGSSSRLSATSDRKSWNQSLESLSLSRNPSQRSVSSGVPSRDRPDSVQFFGKAIFHRGRGRLRRESSDQNSSSSSLDVPEVPVDGMANTVKEQPFIQSVFARRRALRGEAGVPTQKKLQISGPYNFQHITHTRKDSVPSMDRSSRMELVPEFSAMRPRRPTNASISGAQLDESQAQYASHHPETFYHQEDPSAGLNANGASTRDKELPSSPPPPPPPKRYSKRAQSQDKIGFRPSRPPRSPTEGGFTSPVIPPPRTSSRVSVRHERFDSLTTTLTERPATSTGFRKPQPFAPIDPTSPKGLRPPPAPRVSAVVESDREESEESHIIPRAISTPDDAAWPLANNASQLPDVPEEEEHHASTRPSRLSVASNHSSLRGSISVPLLRQLSLKQYSQRSPSNASDTLGGFDLFNAQNALRAGGDDQFADDDLRESWEDDIDYCYEHEAEADCDYAWERPSCDMTREDISDGGRTLGDQTETVITFGGLPSGLLSPGSSDVPALSPASQVSNATQHEAVTPTNLPVTSNFSLPRRDSSAQLLRAPPRPHSPEANFKESQGFSISPSLLIPNDYHQQMIQHEREELEDSEDDEEFLIQGATLIDEPVIKYSKASSNARSSASTMNSTFSEHSMTSSRHKSTTSTSTAFTRWTGSSTSSWQQGRDSTQPIPLKPISDNAHVVVTSPTKAMISPKFDEEMVLKIEPTREKHSRAMSHADLLMRPKQDAAPVTDLKMTKEPLKNRKRARTTSRSHASPQFALFPSVATHGNRI
ncbi:hypothetical protein M426DRAFT_20183 [Hypoxylon sp. CI-4A]|nr:hypothetical protein M426DRAFT_20183 [Hypoxylon sp. CI-4A]